MDTPTTTSDPTASVTTTLPPEMSHGDVLAALIVAETDFTSLVTGLKSAKVQRDASASKAQEDETAYQAVLAQCKTKLIEVRAAETDANLG